MSDSTSRSDEHEAGSPRGDGPRAFRALFPGGPVLLGMIHLPPLPGAPGWDGGMDHVLRRAREDAVALEEAGFHGVLVENFLDAPFFGASVPPETTAAMTRAVAEVVERVSVPVGVNVLRNDARAALGIAVATGARFLRVNVHTGTMWTDQGRLEGRAAETLRTRAALGATAVAILADVLVKHATPPPGLTVEDAARDAWHRGLADALVVSGAATGSATDPARLRSVSRAVPEAPLLVGSGTTPGTVAELLEVAQGVIVGTAVARDGRPGAGIDPARARRLVAAAGL